jgi:hypothetical protein
MENILDWLVSLDICHYKTEETKNYKPTEKSHFYLKGSSERFSSEELIKIFNNEADDKLFDRWFDSIIHHNEWKNKQK